MRHLTNIYDPNKLDAKGHVFRRFGQSMEEAWEERQQYLQGKIIGRPKETDSSTVEEMEVMGFVGIYALD